jgi:orotate phosphoribosyltransferase
MLKMQSPWLDPSEQREMVACLLKHQLIKISDARSLPLKSGGTTDVYMNLRDARKNPAAILAIARALENPLRRLNPHCFIEVPDAVSCFAGPLSLATGVPYITIREQAQEIIRRVISTVDALKQ